MLRSILNSAATIAVGALVGLGITHYGFSLASVPTGSMYPTIKNPAYILVDHVSTEFDTIHRGEIVLFHFPDNPKEIFVKRVIGMPGDTIQVKDGHVYIDHRILNEPYLDTATLGTYGPMTIPAGSYFMMGDNRNNSDDSRFWNDPFVSRSAITGQAIVQLYPDPHTFK